MFGPANRQEAGRAQRHWLAALPIMMCLVLAACSPESQEAQGSQDEVNPGELLADEADTSETVAEVLPQTRQVIPGREVNVPQAGEIVERLPTPPVAPPPPRAVNLGIVVVEQANRLSTRRGRVVLEGTQGVDEDAVCALRDGRTPLCAVLARTAMRRLIAQRSISCTLTLRDNAGDDHTAPCTLGETDLSLWVVAQGWAFASQSASSTLQAAQATARAQQRGLWPHLSDSR